MSSRALSRLFSCAITVSFSGASICAAANLQGTQSVEQRALGPVAVDGTWVVLDELMSEGDFYAPLFSYTSATPVQIDITDLFVVSDQNELYLNGGLVGATPAVPDWQSLVPPVGPLDPPYTEDPDTAWLSPEFSKQSFILPAGSHVFSLRNIHIPLDENGEHYADGTVAFRLVPEPASALLILGGFGHCARALPAAPVPAGELAGSHGSLGDHG